MHAQTFWAVNLNILRIGNIYLNANWSICVSIVRDSELVDCCSIPGRDQIFIFAPVTTSWAHPSSCPFGTRYCLPWCEAASSWSWPLTSVYCWGWECRELYFHCPVHLRGLVFNHRDSYSSAVSSVLGCVLGDWDLISRRGKDFYFCHIFIWALECA